MLKLQAQDIGTFVKRENADLLLFPSMTTCFQGERLKYEMSDDALPSVLNLMTHINNSDTALENFEEGWQKE